MSGAVFLDRDGVVNRNVLNPATGEWESPHRVADLVLSPGALDALASLRDGGWPLFLVSNQPSHAKGKTTLEEIRAIAARVEGLLAERGVRFVRAYYCYHHPRYSGPCVCRKPSPFFLLEARREHGVDLAASWLIGDRDSDVECGRAAGVRTIRVEPDHPGAPAPRVRADHEARDLVEAVALVRARSEGR